MAKIKEVLVIASQVAALMAVMAISIYIGGDMEFGGPLNEIVAIVVGVILLAGVLYLCSSWTRRR